MLYACHIDENSVILTLFSSPLFDLDGAFSARPRCPAPCRNSLFPTCRHLLAAGTREPCSAPPNRGEERVLVPVGVPAAWDTWPCVYWCRIDGIPHGWDTIDQNGLQCGCSIVYTMYLVSIAASPIRLFEKQRTKNSFFQIKLHGDRKHDPNSDGTHTRSETGKLSSKFIW